MPPNEESPLEGKTTLSASEENSGSDALLKAAQTHMQQGIDLLSTGKEGAAQEALENFDKAIAAAQQLPWQTNEKYRWLLAACWMNRGELLSNADDGAALAEAVRSFDEAIPHLESLPHDKEAQYHGTLVMAWMSRSHVLRTLANPDALTEALLSLGRAEEVRKTGPASNDVGLRASIMINRAALQLEFTPPNALESLQEADALIELTSPDEDKQPMAAELGLKARHLFCRAVDTLMQAGPEDPAQAEEWLMRTTDRIEEALQLAARWREQNETPAFEKLQVEFFRFGCHLYLVSQPHFLAEFVLDVLDAERASPMHADSKELRQAGLEMLAGANQALKQRGPATFGAQRMDRLVEIIQSLDAAAEKVQNLPGQVLVA
ncbi:hypothetical protein [Brevifollis gellanilyticus]|nr:hypothetical protein [Brevifollis gellanilyticus]